MVLRFSLDQTKNEEVLKRLKSLAVFHGQGFRTTWSAWSAVQAADIARLDGHVVRVLSLSLSRLAPFAQVVRVGAAKTQICSRLEAIAIRVEAIVSRLEAIAISD